MCSFLGGKSTRGPGLLYRLVVPGGLVALFVLSVGCGPAGRLFTPLTAQDAEQPPDSTLAYSVYLIGDAGAPRAGEQEPTFKLLSLQLDSAGPNSAVVFLGDNIYPSGLPPRSSPRRQEAERRLREQLQIVEDYEGVVVFVPGNHDYGDSGIGGNRAQVRRQELFVEAVLDRGNTFLPDRGFPGPVEVPLADSLVLVALDTQWWLEDVKRYGDTGTYMIRAEAGVVLELEDIMRRHAGKDIVVAGHHPLFSNGSHGGYYPRRNYLPIPLTRRYLGTPQDLSNRKYRLMRNALLSVFEEHDRVVYAAGHEHNLQYFPSGRQHYIVSGAGSKSGYVAEGHGAAFVDEGKGYARLLYYTDSSVWLEFWTPEEESSTGERLFARRIEPPTRPLTRYQPFRPEDEVAAELPPDTTAFPDSLAVPPTNGHEAPVPKPVPGAHRAETDAVPYVFVSPDTVTARASRRYAGGPLRRFLFGEYYRDVWTTPVRMPVIDLAQTAGGLTPIKLGGGLQTISLRMRGGDGDEYVLRSVDKNPARALPRYLRRTFAQDIIRDQISASHPYGAFTIPPMAEAAGIYHTAPRLVYIPEDERLGYYANRFAHMVALLEMRPDEEQRDESRFGRPENIIGTPKLGEEIRADSDHRVDQRAFARARLFDMLIGDWDRHSDQWRWSAFEPYELDPTLEGEVRTQGKIYRPVPRDRDNMYFKFDGPLARLLKLSGNPILRRFSNFGPSFHDLRGLNSSGSALDKRFTSALTRADWVAEAESLQTALTDEVIEHAIRQMPPPAFDVSGDFLIRSLQGRRAELAEVAGTYYEMLAEAVEVVGSDKRERFEVVYQGDSLHVVMYRLDGDGEIELELYRRTFSEDETDEVRLYGLNDDDLFFFDGAHNGIRVRAVGGEGDDVFRATDVASGRLMLYDSEQGNAWEVGPEAKIVRSNDPLLNSYIPEPFTFGGLGPLTSFAYNSDDGLFVGGGLRYLVHGYRKEPYAALHTLRVNYAQRTNAYNLVYTGRVTQVYEDWNGQLVAGAFVVNKFNQFYGLGNETRNTPAVRDRFRAKIQQVRIEPSLHKDLLTFRSVSIGPRFLYTNVEPPDDYEAPEEQPPVGFAPGDFRDTYYVGLEGNFNVDGTDTLSVTQSGARWLNRLGLYQGIRHADKTFLRYSSEFSYFYTFDWRRTLVLAVRFGGATNIGSFEFYQANTLGGHENLRGFRRTRFAGHSSLYQNVELRATLFDFNAYLTRGNAGVLGFLDNGRVWASGEESGKWHQGIGAGVWVSPFYQVVLTGTLGISEEDTLFSLRFGFLF